LTVVWFVVVVTIEIGGPVIYRDDVPHGRFTDCTEIASRLNRRLLEEDKLGVVRCEPELREAG